MCFMLNIKFVFVTPFYYPDQFIPVLMDKTLTSFNCNRCSRLSEVIGVFYIFRKYHLQPVFLWFAWRRKTHITCQRRARVQELSRCLQMSLKIPSQGQETNNVYLWCWQTTASCPEEKICRGSEKSGGASIPAAPAKKHSTLMKTWRMCAYPLTTHQHEYGPNGDRKSPGVCLCASVFIEEMLCTL